MLKNVITFTALLMAISAIGLFVFSIQDAGSGWHRERSTAGFSFANIGRGSGRSSARCLDVTQFYKLTHFPRGTDQIDWIFIPSFHGGFSGLYTICCQHRLLPSIAFGVGLGIVILWLMYKEPPMQ